jgi:hypothetical protein
MANLPIKYIPNFPIRVAKMQIFIRVDHGMKRNCVRHLNAVPLLYREDSFWRQGLLQ